MEVESLIEQSDNLVHDHNEFDFEVVGDGVCLCIEEADSIFWGLVPIFDELKMIA